ncbi:hypothetical protein C7S14_2165 [Burkholderia cepacia]|nr:hypothetical protein C7S14_2165 [Burkholderia cepacia]
MRALPAGSVEWFDDARLMRTRALRMTGRCRRVVRRHRTS